LGAPRFFDDEIEIQVLKGAGCSAQTKGNMWA
jgi:hypothetical protein